MLQQITRNQVNAFVSANNSFKCGPFGLEFFFVFDFFTFGQFFKLRVNLWSFFFLQFQFSKATFVIDWHSRAIGYGLLGIVKTQIISKDGTRISVLEFNRRTCEADKRRVRQGLVHGVGVAINKIILTAMGLIS